MPERPVLFDLKLSELPVVIDEQVRWGDMDAFGHMNNVFFFRLFESARMAYFERIAFTEPDDNGGLGPILAHTECYFRKPLTYPQSLKVGTRISTLKTDSFSMDYGIFINADDPVLAACGSGRIVCFDYRNKTRAPLPEAVTQRIKALEGHSPN